MFPGDLDEEAKARLSPKVMTEISLREANYVCLGDMVALPLYPVSSFFSEKVLEDIPIFLDGIEVGSLCFMTALSSQTERSSLTELQFVAFVAGIDLVTFKSGVCRPLESDYVVINKDHVERYSRHMKSSPVWGGYVHLYDKTYEGLVTRSVDRITVDTNGTARTPRHQSCLDMAARVIHPGQRYLHLYHYLELDYDYEIVNAIKSLDSDNPQQLWSILKMNRDDIDRIQHILSGFCNFDGLHKILNVLREYPDTAKRIFYEYGKDSNPLKSVDDFASFFLNSPNISYADFDKVQKTEVSIVDKFAKDEARYYAKILKLVCYWIYRVRCSIAHNKLGEYHFDSYDDLLFLVNFAEPLLVEMVRYRMLK